MDNETTPAKKGKATDLSTDIAHILLGLRERFSMSQRDFADHIGVSFQQYQKYEKAKDRLSLERAMLLCKALGLSLNIFSGVLEQSNAGFAETEQASFGEPAITAPEQELLAIYAAIPKKNKEKFMDTVRHLAKMA